MTVESLKTLFDWIAVILVFATFLSAAGALITGNIINKRQAEQLRQFDENLTGAKTELGKQQERAANADAKVAGLEVDVATAQTDLAKQQESTATAERHAQEATAKAEGIRLELTDKQIELEGEQQKTAKAQRETAELQEKINGSIVNQLSDRHVDARFQEALKSLPPGTAEIQFVPSDDETIVFSLEIRNALIDSGWDVPLVTRLPLTPPHSGVSIVNSNLEIFLATGPFGDLSMLRRILELGPGKNKEVDQRLVDLIFLLRVRSVRKDETLGVNSFRLIVGQNEFLNGMPLPPR